MAANSLPSAPDVCLIPSPQVWARGMPCLGWPSLFDTWQLPTHPLGAQGCHAVGGPGHTGGHRWVLQGTAPTDSRSTNPLTAQGWAWRRGRSRAFGVPEVPPIMTKAAQVGPQEQD